MSEKDWYTDTYATLGDRLADARLGAGLTQEQLSEQIGVKLATIQAWENDRKEPRANRLQMLSGILGVSLRWLIIGEGAGPTAPQQPVLDQTSIRNELSDIRRSLERSLQRISTLEGRLTIDDGETSDL